MYKDDGLEMSFWDAHKTFEGELALPYPDSVIDIRQRNRYELIFFDLSVKACGNVGFKWVDHWLKLELDPSKAIIKIKRLGIDFG